jgi:hypothetical protein
VGRCGRSERCQSEVIVECVIERVALAKNFTVLTKMNYYDSAALMHVMLHARGLWAAMTEGTSYYTED